VHEPTDVSAREANVERLNKVLLSKSRTPRWGVVATLFWWLVESSGKSVKLVITELRWTPGGRIIVERGLKAALFEPVQPVVDCLVISAILALDLSG